jgi:hypothetical protein
MNGSLKRKKSSKINRVNHVSKCDLYLLEDRWLDQYLKSSQEREGVEPFHSNQQEYKPLILELSKLALR